MDTLDTSQDHSPSSWDSQCQVCSTAIMALVGTSSFEMIGSIDALIMRSNLPCRTCSLILAEIRDSFIMDDRMSDHSSPKLGEAQLKLRVSDWKTPMKIEIVADEEDLKLGELVLGLTDPGTPLLPPLVPHEVLSERLFRKPCWAPEHATDFPDLTALWLGAYIAAWLSRCKDDHGEACNRPAGTDLPTRLIHIQADGSLKLVDTEFLNAGELASLAYATVSHVWGSSNMLKLETTSIGSMRRDIPLGSLARKFREVIKLATSIGIHYIWIDTLCIMQDSRDDWLKEGGRMSAVYQNATINFAPVGGSATDACFTGRNLYGLYRRIIYLMHPTIGPITAYLSASNRVLARMFNGSEGRPPVFKRGWIWQERFLSRRTVYLGETQLAWECGKCLWLESSGFHDQFDKLALLSYNKRTFLGSVPENLTFRPGIEDPNGVVRWKSHWDGFIGGYSASGLTFTTDKLAAVAGIARAFQTASGQEYVAGMWKEHISHGSLLWSVETPAMRPEFRGAPSWSWASVDGHVHMEFERLLWLRRGAEEPMTLHCPTTELLGIDVELPTKANAIFGEVKEAIIRVKGWLSNTSVDELKVEAEHGGLEVYFDTLMGGGEVPPDVVLCVLSTVNSQLDGLILTSSGVQLYERVGVFRWRGADCEAFASVEKTVVRIR